MMKRRICLTALLAIVLFGSGCASQMGWVYSTNTYRGPAVRADKTVAVLPFKDARRNLNKNRIAMYMIPLIPAFGWADYNVPELATQHVNSSLWMNYKPSDDYAKALVDELRAAGLYKDVFFDLREGDSDLVVDGTILSTRYKGTLISYGLSVYGPLLWFVGFPAGTVSNELSVRIECRDVKTQRVLHSKTYTAPRYKKISWIYMMPSDFNYAAMLKNLYRDVVADLGRAAP